MDCYSQATVQLSNISSSSYSHDIGGVVTSLSNSDISRCYTTSNLNYYDDGSSYGSVGGFVSSIGSTSSITDSFSTGDFYDDSGSNYGSVTVGAFTASYVSSITNSYHYSTTHTTCDDSSNYAGCSRATGVSQFYTSTNSPLANWDFSASGPWDDVNEGVDYPVLKDDCSREVLDIEIIFGAASYPGGGNFTIKNASTSEVIFDLDDYTNVTAAAKAFQQLLDQNVVVWSKFIPGGPNGRVHFYVQNLDGSAVDETQLSINGLYLDNSSDVLMEWTGAGSGVVSDISADLAEFDMYH